MTERFITYPLSIDCLWKLRAMKTQVIAHCGAPDCGNHNVLDLDKLIERYGEEYPLFDGGALARKIVCRRCGNKGGMFTLSPDTTPRSLDNGDRA